MSSPLVEWDYLSILQSVSWATGGKFFIPDHPPLYSFLLSFFSGHPGSIMYFRSLNLLAVALTAFLLYGFSRKYLERGLSLLAVAFYLLTPAVIQGVSLLDFADTSWLPLAFLLLLKLAASQLTRFSVSGWLALAAASVLCLSFKITSSAALFLPFALYWLTGGKDVKRSFLPVLAALAAGSIVFYLGWKAASPHLFPVGVTPDTYAIARDTVLSRLASILSPETAGKWLVHLAAVLFWFSPFLLALLALPFLKGRSREVPAVPAEIRFLYFAGLFYFIVYFLAGGLNHGFPRYQMAIWPLIAFLSVFGSRTALLGFLEKDILKTSAIAGLAALPGIIFLPDPLRILNLGLKQALISGIGLGAVFGGLAAVSIFYLFLIWLSSRRANGGAFASLMAAVLAFYLVTDLSQMRARYLTSYEYGTAGMAELAAGLRSSVPAGARIFATPGLLYYVRPDRAPGYGTGNWSSDAAIKAVITGDLPEVVVLSFGSNTLRQFQLFRSDPELTAFLGANYVREEAGTFLLWRKKARLEKK